MLGRLLIVGTSGHASVIYQAQQLATKRPELAAYCDAPQYELAGFLNTFHPIDTYAGYPVCGSLDALPAFVAEHGITHAILGIGENHARFTVAEQLHTILPDLHWATVIHPSAIIDESVRLGAGTFIAAGAIIAAGTQVGEHVLVNTGACIDHDNVLADFCSVAPSATTAGRVEVGLESLIGIGATIREKVRIGKHCVIGGQAFVRTDCDDNGIYVGVPAKRVKTRQRTDQSLQ